jgi:hypothetical protein
VISSFLTEYSAHLWALPANMALQRTRRPRFRSGRSLRSLGSPLNARSFGGLVFLVLLTSGATGDEARRRAPDVIANVVRQLAASGFEPIDVEDVPALFPEGERQRIRRSGAPVVQEWVESAGECHECIRSYQSTGWCPRIFADHRAQLGAALWHHRESTSWFGSFSVSWSGRPTPSESE